MDLVYLVRNGEINEDLRISLRSIDKFAPKPVKIWIVGYKPSWVSEYVGYVSNPQNDTSWANARMNLLAACKTKQISDDFILMNDDFILTKPIQSWEQSLYKIRNTFEKQIKIWRDLSINSIYTNAFSNSLGLIKKLSNKDIVNNYELHMPMIVNKHKMLSMFENPDFSEYMSNNSLILYRSFYGNMFDVKFDEVIDDVKISKDRNDINTEWVSVFDDCIGSDRYPKFNSFIKSLFDEPCKYERCVIKVFDHLTHPIWSKIYRDKFESTGITNGAYTYSEDIIKYHLPIIKEILSKQIKYRNVLISTVSTLSKEIIPNNTDLIIEYLHEAVARDLPKCINNNKLGIKFVYITSRIEMFNALRKHNINCVLLPMAIDISLLEKYKKSKKYTDKRVIYFGNKYLGKNGYYEKTKESFIKNGWIFDEISYNVFNNSEKLTREEILERISKYKYGIGEGRCVLEMNALGVKTLICAVKNQGLMMNESDFEVQKSNNFSDGTFWTFSQDLDTCIDNFNKAMIKTLDVHEILPELQKQLRKLL